MRNAVLSLVQFWHVIHSILTRKLISQQCRNMCVNWCMLKVYSKVVWVVIKTRKVLQKYNLKKRPVLCSSKFVGGWAGSTGGGGHSTSTVSLWTQFNLFPHPQINYSSVCFLFDIWDGHRRSGLISMATTFTKSTTFIFLLKWDFIWKSCELGLKIVLTFQLTSEITQMFHFMKNIDDKVFIADKPGMINSKFSNFPAA